MGEGDVLQDNFKAFRIFAYKLFSVFDKRYDVSEIILNLLFIILIIIISYIIYWDTINRKVSAVSRCKRQLDVYNKNNSQYIIRANDKNKNNLFNITYDVKQNNTEIKCNCINGNFVNNFNDIPVKDLKTNKDLKVNKTCSCEKYYNVGLNGEDIVYDGDPSILRYINTGYSDFFDSMVYNPYK